MYIYCIIILYVYKICVGYLIASHLLRAHYKERKTREKECRERESEREDEKPTRRECLILLRAEIRPRHAHIIYALIIERYNIIYTGGLHLSFSTDGLGDRSAVSFYTVRWAFLS